MALASVRRAVAALATALANADATIFSRRHRRSAAWLELRRLGDEVRAEIGGEEAVLSAVGATDVFAAAAAKRGVSHAVAAALFRRARRRLIFPTLGDRLRRERRAAERVAMFTTVAPGSARAKLGWRYATSPFRDTRRCSSSRCSCAGGNARRGALGRRRAARKATRHGTSFAGRQCRAAAPRRRRRLHRVRVSVYLRRCSRTPLPTVLLPSRADLRRLRRERGLVRGCDERHSQHGHALSDLPAGH